MTHTSDTSIAYFKTCWTRWTGEMMIHVLPTLLALCHKTHPARLLRSDSCQFDPFRLRHWDKRNVPAEANFSQRFRYALPSTTLLATIHIVFPDVLFGGIDHYDCLAKPEQSEQVTSWWASCSIIRLDLQYKNGCSSLWLSIVKWCLQIVSQVPHAHVLPFASSNKRTDSRNLCPR